MAIAGLPPITLPRKLGGVARTAGPAHGMESGKRLTRDDLNRSNTQLSDYRFTRSAPALMRSLFVSNGLLSTAVLNLVSMADSGYDLRAYSTFTQEFSREGLLAAEAVLSGLDTVWDSSKGYADKTSVASLIETSLLETALTGGICGELVLDKYRLPNKIVLAPYDQIFFVADGRGGVYPQQQPSTGDAIDLNYPTVFVGEAVKSALEKHATPFTAAGVQKLWMFENFLQEGQRTLRVAGEPRLTASLDYDKVVRSAPPEIQSDADRLSEYLDAVRVGIEGLLRGLAPEDAIVSYDLVTMDKIESGSEKKDFATLLDTTAGMAASALKSNASLLGLRLGGSQNVASTEALLATKMARRLQLPVESVMSRALTLAVRLLGIDAYIEFSMKPIELRPSGEMAAHRAMDQNRILELNSIGSLTDDEMQSELGLGSRPDGAPKLSGSMWFGSSKLPEAVPMSGGNAINNEIKIDGPSSAGGTDNAVRP